MLPIERKAVTAIVVFQGSPMRSWWRFFTSPGYRHVLVLLPVWFPRPGALSRQWTLWVEPVGWGLSVDLVYERPKTLAQNLLSNGDATEAIAIPLILPPKRAYIPRGVWSCVTSVKAVLGLECWMIVTPKRLAAWLRRNGGKRIEVDGATIRSRKAERP